MKIILLPSLLSLSLSCVAMLRDVPEELIQKSCVEDDRHFNSIIQSFLTGDFPFFDNKIVFLSSSNQKERSITFKQALKKIHEEIESLTENARICDENKTKNVLELINQKLGKNHNAALTEEELKKIQVHRLMEFFSNHDLEDEILSEELRTLLKSNRTVYKAALLSGNLNHIKKAASAQLHFKKCASLEDYMKMIRFGLQDVDVTDENIQNIKAFEEIIGRFV